MIALNVIFPVYKTGLGSNIAGPDYEHFTDCWFLLGNSRQQRGHEAESGGGRHQEVREAEGGEPRSSELRVSTLPAEHQAQDGLQQF